MAIRSKSGIKRARQAKKRRVRNVQAKRVVKVAFKAAERAIAAKSAEAKALVAKAVSAMDKAVERGIIHKNKAARGKSRLVLKLNRLK
ncbi:30S ribosomal protein S20 [Candidatus Margulisiibacteriota bacterium]